MTSEKTAPSNLEREVSVAKELFLGNIIEENIYPFPIPQSEEVETLRMVLDSIDRFMAGEDEKFRHYDAKGEQPESYLNELKELGLFGLIIPEEHGGIGLSNTAYSRVLQQTSRYDAATSLTIGAHSSIGMKGLLLFGTAEQKKRYLPLLASGEMIAAFCLTEPGCGSDAAAITTNAQKNQDGSWTLNGEKIWITNGAMADFFTVFARTNSEKGKISAFLVERSFAGVQSGAKEDKMGIRASATTTVSFDNVKVPAENLLGEEGKGFKVAMAILNNGRTGLGGGCIGAMKRAIELASQYATERKQFGKSISEFGLVKEKIGQMAVSCFAAESVVSMVGHYIDSGMDDYSVEAAISKVFVSEALWQVANEALQVAGGNGFMKDYVYEKIVRDSRINMIFEGTNEILRLYIALSGMKDAGDYLKEVGKGLSGIFNDPIKGFGVLSQYATKRLSQFTPLGRNRISFVHPTLRGEAEVFEKYALRLEQATESVLRRHKKEVIEKQFLMKRLGDIASDIFVGLCVLSRVTTMINGSSAEKRKHEVGIAKIFTQQAKRRMFQNLRRLDHNEDDLIEGLSDLLVAEGKYPWDTI